MSQDVSNGMPLQAQLNQTVSERGAPISNVNIYLMSPGQQMNSGEQVLHDENEPSVMDGLRPVSRSIRSAANSHNTSHINSGNRSCASTKQSRGKNIPPPVVPLYQLDKYMVKPSVQLKRQRRLREEQASKEATNKQRIQSATRNQHRNANTSTISIRKTKGSQSTTFRGCMLKQVKKLGVGAAADKPPMAVNKPIRGIVSAKTRPLEK